MFFDFSTCGSRKSTIIPSATEVLSQVGFTCWSKKKIKMKFLPHLVVTLWRTAVQAYPLPPRARVRKAPSHLSVLQAVHVTNVHYNSRKWGAGNMLPH